jgi:hypothetical protein
MLGAGFTKLRKVSTRDAHNQYIFPPTSLTFWTVHTRQLQISVHASTLLCLLSKAPQECASFALGVDEDANNCALCCWKDGCRKVISVALFFPRWQIKAAKSSRSSHPHIEAALRLEFRGRRRVVPVAPTIANPACAKIKDGLVKLNFVAQMAAAKQGAISLQPNSVS